MHNNSVFNHLKTINKHKLTVMDLCFKIGLIKQGFLHDLSKYSPEEFLIGIKYYKRDIQVHGYIIREEINIILSTGLTTVLTKKTVSWV